MSSLSFADSSADPCLVLWDRKRGLSIGAAARQRLSSFRRWKITFDDQLSPYRNGLGVIDREHSDRDKTDCGQSDQPRTAPSEMVRPMITARIIESDNLACTRIESTNVRPLVAIASRTREGEVVELGLPTVLFRDDVINVERPRVERLAELAIFAKSPGTQSNATIEFLGNGHGN